MVTASIPFQRHWRTPNKSHDSGLQGAPIMDITSQDMTMTAVRGPRSLLLNLGSQSL